MPLDLTSPKSDGHPGANLDFLKLVDDMPTPYMVMDRDLTIIYANTAYLTSVERSLDQIGGRYIFDSFPETAERVAAVRAIFLKTLDGVTTRLDRQDFLLEHADGTTSTKCWQCVQTPYFNEVGEVAYIVQHAEDVTESEKLRRTNDAISLELDHRVKNVFSIVQAVAALAGQNCETLDEYRHDFEDRIIAMSRTHDSLSRRDWAGLSLRQIFNEALAHYGGLDSDRITFQGRDVVLNPRASQMASLLIHEFATNAAKYGCFSQSDGQLSITVWPDLKHKSLKVEWKESGLSGIEPSDRTGMGTKLESFMPNVSIDRAYEDDGLRMTIHSILIDSPSVDSTS